MPWLHIENLRAELTNDDGEVIAIATSVTISSDPVLYKGVGRLFMDFEIPNMKAFNEAIKPVDTGKEV